MDATMIGILGISVALLLIFLKVPIAIVMGSVGFIGIAILVSLQAALGIIKAIPYEIIGDWNLSAIPMFLLMGYLASASELTNGLFLASRIFFGRVPGSLAGSTVVASALFASSSGSSVASAAALSRIAVPEMLKAGYSPGLATGAVASSGTLGSLIPPSVLMIVFGILADVSISKLFMAGVLPGILSAGMFILYIFFRALLCPQDAPRDVEKYTRQEKLAALKDVWPLPVIILSVLGGIFFGVFTATEAGAVGAALVAFIALLRKKLTLKIWKRALFDTAEGTSVIFIIVVGAAIFSRFMSFSQLPEALSMWLMSMTDSPLMLILAVCIIYLLLGAVLESISIMLLTIPLMMPLLLQMDINLIWFGILIIKLLEIGLCTPPVGMNVYVVKSSLGDLVTLQQVFRGTLGFILVDLITLMLLIFIPDISLWLPSFMD